MVFTRCRRLPDLKKSEFYAIKIDFSISAKYLDVIFYPKPTWKVHVDVVVKKSKAASWACRGTIGKTWASNAMLYTVIIAPIITYAS